ncbi:MAG TPA: hypothetical protein VJV78_44160 [Polyangiales bacterium]|nr:hypothetical protein [Polyangiales bacterium]
MLVGHRGYVDFEDASFVVRINGDPVVVAKLKDIQRRRWNPDKAAWIVEPHWPSVRRLLHIAADLGFQISAEAREAQREVREQSESLEYLLDVVHDNHGAAWFICKTGDDDELRHQVSALPDAYWDDAWWIPTDWEQCCQPLLEIVQSDARVEVSPAAQLLLTEEDVAHLFVRSSVSAPAATAAAPATRKPRVSSRERAASQQPRAARMTKDTG